MSLRSALLSMSVLFGGCAGLKGQTTICPEYRDLRCVTAYQCAMDKARGCEVCQCESIDSARARPLPAWEQTPR